MNSGLRWNANSGEMDGEAGFGNTPRSFALRVRIIGYASPRWRGAKSATEADRLNFKLSSKRAEAVRAIVEKELQAAGQQYQDRLCRFANRGAVRKALKSVV